MSTFEFVLLPILIPFQPPILPVPCHQVLSHEAAHRVKHLGLSNDLIERVKRDPYFDPIKGELKELLDARSFVGRAPEQVDRFLQEWVVPALKDEECKEAIERAANVDLNV